MKPTERRLRKIEAVFAARKARLDGRQEPAIISDGKLYRLVDVFQLTRHWRDGRNREYMDGHVSIAELATRQGISPLDGQPSFAVDESDYREDLIEEEECETKGWELNFVDGDVNRRLAWFAWQENKRILVSEVGFLKSWSPEKIEELEKMIRGEKR